MSELFSELGISLPALISQGVNFLIVLVVLTVFVYKPLAKVVDERRKRIEQGLEDAKQAELKLSQIAEKEKRVLAEAEKTALVLIKEAEGKAAGRSRELIEIGEKRAAGIVKEGKTLAQRQAAEEMASLQKEAVNFVKQAIEKTVELDPDKIDEKLIDQAVKLLRKKAA
ncbi:MAG TPA: ATP synthase F0 subunit B [Candidatus Paceibacterota bacterium]